MKTDYLDRRSRRNFLVGGAGTALAVLTAVPKTLRAAGTPTNPTFPPSAPYLNVKDFAAVGNGSNDDSGAIQAAINYAVNSSTPYSFVYLPEGVYLLNETITISGSVRLVGTCRETSLLRPADGVTAIIINTAQGVQLESFGIQWLTSQQNPAYGILCIGSSGANPTANQLSVMRDLYIDNAYVAIYCSAIADGLIDSCVCGAWYLGGIFLGNTNSFDAGDTVVVNCLLTSAIATSGSFGIHVQEGGARVENNKIIGGTFGLHFVLAGGSSSADLFVVGNSFEAAPITQYSVYMSNAATNGAGFATVIITGNELFSNGGSSLAIQPINGTSPWLGELIVSSNICGVYSSTQGVISISNVTDFLISNNVLYSSTGGGTGVAVGQGCSNGTIGPNNFRALTAAVSTSSQNLASLGIASQLRTITGTASGAATTMTGALYTGTVPVTIPTGAFTDAPTVMITARAGNATGAVSAGLASGTTPSTSNFTVAVFAATSGQTVTFDWVAFGN